MRASGTSAGRRPAPAAGGRGLGRLRADPDRPYVAVLGGAKVSDKLGVLDFVEQVDALLIGGAMAFTLIAADGDRSATASWNAIASTRCGPSPNGPGRGHAARAPAGRRRRRGGARRRLAADRPGARDPAGLKGLDIGPRTVEEFARILADAKTILWNGPMGVFELEPFSAGTRGVATAIAGASAFSVVGGGDSLLAVKRAGLEDAFDHLSTGGGASLEFLEGRPLPGIAVLEGTDVAERTPIVAANWKMHKTHLEAIQAVQKLSYLVDRKDRDLRRGGDLPAVHRAPLGPDPDRLGPTPVRARGAGRPPRGRGRVHREVSARCSALDVSYVIVGHSERRQLAGEDDETVNRRRRRSSAPHGADRVRGGDARGARGRTETKVAEQVRRAFDGIEPERAATRRRLRADLGDRHGTQRRADGRGPGRGADPATLAERVGAEVAARVRVQYGGSVKPGNIREFMAHPRSTARSWAARASIRRRSP